MAKGRKTGGRAKGTPNRRSLVRRQALSTAAGQLRTQLDAEAAEPEHSPPAPSETARWFRGDAHALLRLIYTDATQPIELRVDAAKSAIRFERPALVASHVQHSNAPSTEVIKAMTTDQLKALLAKIDQGSADGVTIDGALLPGPENEATARQSALTRAEQRLRSIPSHLARSGCRGLSDPQPSPAETCQRPASHREPA